jgi:predicted house-cleaning noncanonical NTP pyrophosphatase (MazG superfamily)
MPKFKFSKLVRDNIVDQQLASGAKPSFRQLSKVEHIYELINKLTEEAKEIENAESEEIVAEIADVQQILDDLKALLSISTKDVTEAQKSKNSKNGAFKKGLFVNYVDVAEGNPWTDYYRKNADRYPEID